MIFGGLSALFFGWLAIDALRKRRFWAGAYKRTYLVTRRSNPIHFWSSVGLLIALTVASFAWAVASA